MMVTARNLPLHFTNRAPVVKPAPTLWSGIELRRRAILAAAAMLLCVIFLAAIERGTTRASIRDLFDAASPLHYVALNLRLPRALTGVIVGASLAIAGALLQGLLRNPLADPGVLGVTGFAGLGAALAYLFLPLGLLLAPVAAFGSALFAAFLVIAMSSRQAQAGSSHLILCGIALGATASALLSVAMLLSHDDVMPLITWLVGSVSGKSWSQLATSGALCLVGCIAAMLLSHRLNVVQLGEAAARSLGVNYRVTRALIVMVASLLVASSASLAGLIGFVGLIVPHLGRMLAGDDYRTLLPLSAIMGAALVLGGDLAARTLLSPTELPVGAVTALCGGPFFFYLVLSPRKAKLCPASH